MTEQENHHRLDVRANHWAARLAIALINFLAALFVSPALFFSFIYLFGANDLRGRLYLVFMTLSFLAVVVFAMATAVVALRRGRWRLKYQLWSLVGGAAIALSWALDWSRKF